MLMYKLSKEKDCSWYTKDVRSVFVHSPAFL